MKYVRKYFLAGGSFQDEKCLPWRSQHIDTQERKTGMYKERSFIPLSKQWNPKASCLHNSWWGMFLEDREVAAWGHQCASYTSKQMPPLPRKIIQISILPRQRKFFSWGKRVSLRKDVLALEQQPASTAFPPFTTSSQEPLTLITYFLCHVCLQNFLTLKVSPLSSK